MPDICTTPPDFTLPIFHSAGSYTLSSHAGNVILLSFMNLHCGHCWNWVPRWSSIQTDYAVSGIEVVTVVFNSDPEDVTDAMFEAKLAYYGLADPTFTVLKDSGGWGTVAADYRSGYVGGVAFPYAYLVTSSHLIANKWRSNSTSEGDLVSFDSGDDDEVESFIRHRIDDLLATRPPWQTALALDFSGSMNDDVTVAGTTKPKIEFLQDAVDIWLRVWKDYACCEDKLALVKFGNHAESDGTLLPVLPDANVEGIMANLETSTAGGCTALGAGIATGIDILETQPISVADPHERYMVVFTDGMQNRNPMVWPTADCGGGVCIWEPQIRQVPRADVELMGQHLCGSDDGASDYAGTLPRILHENPMQTAIHTIGIGAPASYLGLLGLIASETSGVSYTEADVWPNVEDFFLGSLIETFRGSSLGLVAKATGEIEGAHGEFSMSFRLNRSVRKISIVLSWVDEAAPLEFELRKGDTRLDMSNKQTVRPRASITTLPFPLYQPATKPFVRGFDRYLVTSKRVEPVNLPSVLYRPSKSHIEAEGEYQLTVRRMFAEDGPDVPFNLTVLADDKVIEVELPMSRQVYFTGEHIPIHVETSVGGEPVDNLFSVTAKFVRPRYSFQNLYVEYIDKVDDKPAIQDDDYLAKRFDAVAANMLLEKDIAQQVRALDQDVLKISPAHSTKSGRAKGARGKHSLKYTETKVPGHYKVEARVRGVSPKAGVFERVISKTFLVVPRVDFDASGVKVSMHNKNQAVTIDLRPMDRYGNLLGPGFAGQIALVLDDELVGHVHDSQDGTYRIEAKLTADALKPENDVIAGLWVAGERVFSTRLDRLGSLRSE